MSEPLANIPDVSPLSKNMGVSQWLSSVSVLPCTRLASAKDEASDVSQRKSGIMLSSPARMKHSGCHCTPTMLLYSVLSTASATPSEERAETLRREPGSLTA